MILVVRYVHFPFSEDLKQWLVSASNGTRRQETVRPQVNDWGYVEDGDLREIVGRLVIEFKPKAKVRDS